MLLGGSPLRLFRLSEAGDRVITRVLDGADVKPNPLTDRLLDAGALHPQPAGPEAGGPRACDVTIVIPAYDTAVRRPFHPGPVLVVDDASPTPVTASGALVIRRRTNGGPGAARMTGLEAVTTPFVAFVDADVELDDGWLEPLLAHFSDQRVALVAPRVRSAAGAGRLAAYESLRSPLDLGHEAARVSPRTRVSYVPAAVIVARVDAVRDAGGFDPALRTGEDVDLVWKLVAAGHRVRYEPSAVVHHRPRADIGSWVRQRVGYGRSAAPLSRRHEGALAPVGISGWSAAVWVLGAFGHPVLGLALAGGSSAALPRKMPGLPVNDAVALAVRGHLGAGRQLAAALRSVWWPFALVSRRTRRLLVLAFVLPAAMDWWRARRRTELGLISFVGLGALDDLSYAVGVWIGMVSGRTTAPAVPDFTNFPIQRSRRSSPTNSAT